MGFYNLSPLPDGIMGNVDDGEDEVDDGEEEADAEEGQGGVVHRRPQQQFIIPAYMPFHNSLLFLSVKKHTEKRQGILKQVVQCVPRNKVRIRCTESDR